MYIGKRNFIVRLQATLAFVIGLLLIAHPLVGFIARFFRAIHPPIAMLPSINLGLLSTIVGILLIYNAFYLYRRLQTAFLACSALAVLSLAIVIAQRRASLVVIGLLVIFLAWILSSHKLYSVKSDIVRVALGIRASIAVASIGLAYGTIGFLYLGPKDFHHIFSAFEAATTSFRILFTLNDTIGLTGLRAERFVDSLNIIGLVTYGIGLASLFKPVRFALGATSQDKLRAETVIRASATTSEDYFKLWPNDKRYFFSQSGQSLVAYKCSGRTAIILGDPSGQPEEFGQLMDDFLDFIHINGWLCAVFGASNNSKLLYESKRLKTIFIGNEAVIDIAHYVSHTIRSKHFRYVANKAREQKLTVEVWGTFDAAQFEQLRRVSDAWLARNGRREYSFFMGSFDETYLKQSKVAVLKQAGTVIAYVNLVPSLTDHDASIDHFRSSAGAPPVAMHYLISELIVTLHKQGKERLNIGMSPLSGLAALNNPSLNERLLKVMKRLARRYYSFAGVEQFKGKFQPSWHPLYLCYEGSPTALIAVARDLGQASSLPK